MKIATFNANSIRSRLGILLDWLKAARPDVVGIQETKVVDDLFPVQPIQELGYHVVFRGEKGYNGVALISREPASDVRFGLDDGGNADETRLVCARVGGIAVLNTYVPQGRELDHPMYRYKIDWFARVRRYLERHFTPRDKVVWVGDLNIAPEPIDLHNPDRQSDHVCFHIDCRNAFKHVLEWGMVDVYRKHHPEPGRYSWYDYRTADAVQRDMGWRVDHVLATPPLAAKSVAAEIDLAPRLLPSPSDHTFVWAEFRL